MMEKTDYLPAFCYSIGLYQEYGHPEIICFGLKTELIQRLVNDACVLIKEGRALQPYTEYNDFLNGCSVQFIPVHKDYYPNYLGHGGFFYGDTDFPALQLVWSNKEHRYPWEEEAGDTWRSKQPLLDRDTNFRFYEEGRLLVYTNRQVLEGHPILYVLHENDGNWQFYSGCEPDFADVELALLEEITELDPSVNQLYHLGYNQYAWRSDAEGKWEWGEE